MSEPLSIHRLRLLRRYAVEARNSYVGTHWPSMEALRFSGVGVELAENWRKDPAIRRHISTYSPDFVIDLIDALIACAAIGGDEP